MAYSRSTSSATVRPRWSPGGGSGSTQIYGAADTDYGQGARGLGEPLRASNTSFWSRVWVVFCSVSRNCLEHSRQHTERKASRSRRIRSESPVRGTSASYDRMVRVFDIAEKRYGTISRYKCFVFCFCDKVILQVACSVTWIGSFSVGRPENNYGIQSSFLVGEHHRYWQNGAWPFCMIAHSFRTTVWYLSVKSDGLKARVQSDYTVGLKTS